jgi:hypothetical protein
MQVVNDFPNLDWQAGFEWSSGAVPTSSDDVLLRDAIRPEASGTIHSLTMDNSFLIVESPFTATDGVMLSGNSEIDIFAASLTASTLSGYDIQPGTAPLVFLYAGASINAAISNIDLRVVLDSPRSFISGQVSDSSITVGGGAVLELGSAVVDSTVAFAGSPATLQLDDPSGVSSSSTLDIGLRDIIDLRGVEATAASYDGHTLTVTKNGGGTLTFTVSGDLAADHVTFTTDGQGGTNLFWTQGVPDGPPLPPINLSDGQVQNGYENATRDVSTQSLTGYTQAGATVTVYDGTHELGTTTADGSGDWTFRLGHLTDGAHSLTATAANAAGTGAPSAALAFTVVTVAPNPFVLYINQVGANWQIFGYTDPNLKIALSDNGTQIGTATADSRGVWSVTVPLSASLTHDFSASSTDAAGNVGTSPGETLFSLRSAPLVGGAGNDVLIAWQSDTLTGGAGHDTFVVDGVFTTRAITDFTPGTDVLELDASAYHNYGWVMSHSTQVGADTVIDVGGHSLTLDGVTRTSLHASDFIFA